MESKPWYVYAEYRNTGTSATTRNRERFGFRHQQLTGRDDVLALDYITGDFDEVHGVSLDYEAPFSLDSPEWRFGVHGSWSQFDTREAGFTATGLDARSTRAGAWVSRQLLQRGALFVDASVGAEWEQLDLDNDSLGVGAEVDYALPHAELSLFRQKATSSLQARLGLVAGFTDAGSGGTVGGQVLPDEIDIFGTPDADEDFTVARLDADLAFYLEPLLFPRAWQDPSTPGSSTLAHEIALRLRGQYAFGNRLIPQYQEVGGGFDTVRGYEQSVAVGDDLIGGSAEYRLHLPRLLGPSDRRPPDLPGLGRFRVRPTHVYDIPDWDLIVRVFSDVAHLQSSHALPEESDETLVSAGAGLELRLKRYLTLRADLGHALTEVRSRRGGEKGDTRAHLAATVVY